MGEQVHNMDNNCSDHQFHPNNAIWKTPTEGWLKCNVDGSFVDVDSLGPINKNQTQLSNILSSNFSFAIAVRINEKLVKEFDCLMEQPSNDISQEQARESLIAISYTSPEEVEEDSLTYSDVKPVVTTTTTNGVTKTNSEAAEKLRSELISISYDESPDVTVSPTLPNGV
ncbi:hypothetical protein N665_0128s0006 [Sinapis alba]|nr:hypothetical protein N665_0128s0006 [Sinapis alba]